MDRTCTTHLISGHIPIREGLRGPIGGRHKKAIVKQAARKEIELEKRVLDARRDARRVFFILSVSPPSPPSHVVHPR